jgi:hypothetical protein
VIGVRASPRRRSYRISRMRGPKCAGCSRMLRSMEMLKKPMAARGDEAGRAQRAPGPLGRARRAARAAAPHSPGSGASVAARALPRHARGRGHLTVRTPSRRVFGLAREPPECLRRAARAMEGAPAGAAPEPRTRKPYTITKQRECWTEEEHQRFLDALKLHGRAWRRIEGAWLRRAPRRPGAPLPQPLPPRSLLWRSPSGVGEPTSLAPCVRFCAAVGPGNVR